MDNLGLHSFIHPTCAKSPGMPSSVLTKWEYKDRWHMLLAWESVRHNIVWRAKDKAWGATGVQRWETSTLPGVSGQLHRRGVVGAQARGWGRGCYGTITPYLCLAYLRAWPKPRWPPTCPQLTQYPPDFLKALRTRPWRKRNRGWTVWERELGSRSYRLVCTYVLRTLEWDWLVSVWLPFPVIGSWTSC